MQNLKKINFHMHSSHSDGLFDFKTIINRAKEQDMDAIGFSDHYMTKKLPEEFQVVYLEWYISDFHDTIKEYKASNLLRIGDKELKVYLGIEIDCGNASGADVEEWDFDNLNKLDFVLLEYINDKNWQGKDLEEVMEAIKGRIRVPIGLAHNNLMENFAIKDKDDCERLAGILENYNIFVELNEGENFANSIDGTYYFEFFSEDLIDSLKNHKIKFSIGTDSHQFYNLNEIDKALNFMEKYGLEQVKF
ncbi:MAG: PHP domain-containing protein [Promethearchaeota archaeon]